MRTIIHSYKGWRGSDQKATALVFLIIMLKLATFKRPTRFLAVVSLAVNLNSCIWRNKVRLCADRQP